MKVLRRRQARLLQSEQKKSVTQVTQTPQEGGQETPKEPVPTPQIF